MATDKDVRILWRTEPGREMAKTRRPKTDWVVAFSAKKEDTMACNSAPEWHKCALEFAEVAQFGRKSN